MPQDSQLPSMGATHLQGQVVVLSGATGALGRATAQLLTAHGAVVAALGRNQRRLAALAALPGVRPWQVDLRDTEALRRVAGEVRAELGDASSVVALAGGNGFPVPTAQETLAHWRTVLDDDLTTTFATIHAFLDQIVRHPASTVVTMSSSAALRAGRSSAAYAAAKAGVVGLTRHLAGELGPQGVRVNCIAPSAVDNDRFAEMPTQQREALAQHLPMQRLGRPEDVAEAVLYLAGPASSYVTGAVLELGGPGL